MSKRLNNGFLLSNQFVNHKTNLLFCLLHNDNNQRFRIIFNRLHIQNIMQTENRNDTSTKINNFFGLYKTDIFFCNILNSIDAAKRNRIFFFSDFHHQSLNNCQCQRKRNRKGTSLTGNGLCCNITTKCLNFSFYNVKTNASSGNISNLFCC